MERTALIGSSPSFRALLEDVQVVAPADCAVLIQGETGTGKEVIAQAIHEASPRRQHRFVAVNCAAIPAALLESELFGHERGAFTGAVVQRLGRFQAADRGTLFLDEIGELPIELQPKLLRALQEREVERLGCSHATRVDVRIVAATNQNLEQMVRERRFRMDLYYRLKVFPITLPPLRERIGDIPLLVDHFLRSYAHRQGKSIEFVPDEVMAAIETYSWPGNIRELQNFIERSVILTRGPALQAPIEVLERNDFLHTRCARWRMQIEYTSLVLSVRHTGSSEERWCCFQTRTKPDNSHRQNAETRDLARNSRATCSAIEPARQRATQGSIGVCVRLGHNLAHTSKAAGLTTVTVDDTRQSGSEDRVHLNIIDVPLSGTDAVRRASTACPLTIRRSSCLNG